MTFPKGHPDPKTYFLVASNRALAGERVDPVDQCGSPQGPYEVQSGNGLVYGDNNDFAEGLFQNAQLAHYLGTPGMDVPFQWLSEAKVTAYLTDRESVLFSRDALAKTLLAMSKAELSGSNPAGHSVGACFVMDTLRPIALRKIKAVILILADIEADVFRGQAPPVLADRPIFLVVSSDDKALTSSARLRGQKDRLGFIRSVDETGGLVVTVIDLGQIKSEDMFSHLKFGTSPEVIGLIQSLRAQGMGMLISQEEPGLIDSAVGLLRIGSVGLLSLVTSR